LDINALTMQVNQEHDACGIFAQLEKAESASHKPIEAGIQALQAMRHRAGYVGEEGDGCGLLIDLPRDLWRSQLQGTGLDGDIVDDERFYVGHFFLSREKHTELWSAVERILDAAGLKVLVVRKDIVVHSSLLSQARRENPVFVQVAGIVSEGLDMTLFRAEQQIEQIPSVHVASISRHTVVYKVVGDADTLYNYYPDLQHESCRTRFVLAHTRYSTNTATSFSRVQPFSLLGHNGEINTIARFYTEAGMLGITIDPNFSDSQMIDKGLHALISECGWSLFEAVELIFPPIVHEIKKMPDELSDMYMFFRSLWGPFSQGPAAMMIRFGNEAVFSVDALGLRPMWQVETKSAYCFTSEPGIIPAEFWVSDALPLSPGEKIGAKWIQNGNGQGKSLRLYDYEQMQNEVFELASSRYQFRGEHRSLHFATSLRQEKDVRHPARDTKPFEIRATAFGFRRYDYHLMDAEMKLGAEPIQSLGYDGPIAALSPEMGLLSDFLQEAVAVVTNPAIDREREIEHFSTRTILGRRPSLAGLYTDAPRVEVASPILLEELSEALQIAREDIESIAHHQGTLLYEDALEMLRTSTNGTVEILLHREAGEGISAALVRFQMEALEAVQAGAHVIVLDDRLQFMRGMHIDPYLAVAAVHRALLRPASAQGGEHLRRRSSLVLRSGGIRNLHDIACALGIGADAVVPYLMWERAGAIGGVQGIENLYMALTKGLEKVISTLGIHEIRGYERLFGAIGLTDEVANWLGVPTFCGNETVGYSIPKMEEQAEKRQAIYQAETEKGIKLAKARPYFPKVCMTAAGVAQGKLEYDKFTSVLDSLESKFPINLRHALSLRETDQSFANDSDVDSTIDGHAYPFVISSMSFGAQGETSFRAYAEAAYRLNIVCLNGEGGEIKDLLGKYPKNRGREIASGRFGVNAELCSDAYVLEIKIGQGAKPGEGGHLPGSKVTAQVAAARNAAPGVDLISPSNNHDIYSIEDLAQVIYELKQVNPFAKVAVKVPVVPGIGTISVGIAKAGADIVELSGFDGGTGAARSHAIRHVGMPIEIGVKLAHDALCESGLRDFVEIWADGGMKSGLDVIKMILLGANRVGFATMAIAAIGCTDCKMCMHREVCSMFNEDGECADEEACSKDRTHMLHDFEGSVAGLERFFTAIGQHVQDLTIRLGAKRTQDLVGRRDLLTQVLASETLDLGWLLQFDESFVGKGTTIAVRELVADVKDTVSTIQAVALATGTEGVPIRLARDLDDTLYPEIQAVPRALGVQESGNHVRNRRKNEDKDGKTIEIYTVAGAGFAAYHSVGMTTIAHGGAQDGVGKTAFGGKIIVLKSKNQEGIMVGGSVGKSLAYGAQHGLFIIQGNADARAGIRLSGADIVIGGEVEDEVRDGVAYLGTRSNIKGFAFEYMTAGRAVVLGDPGPWICSGMTGGRVYLRHLPEKGLTEEALRRRLAKGAKVTLTELDARGAVDVHELLQAYQVELRRSGQVQVARGLQPLITNPRSHFMMVEPDALIMDQEIFTE
jgi:glutamate synthase (NADPH) large chain